MSIFEICMVVMAVSTLASAISTVAKNVVHSLGVKKARKLVDEVGVGAQVGAVLGGAVEAFLRPETTRRVKELEAAQQASKAILDDLVQALGEARAQRDARGTLVEQLGILWTRFAKKKEGK